MVMPFISINDNSHPHLVFDGNENVVPWNSGELQEIGLCSQFMRITARGLHYPSYSSNHRWLWEGADKVGSDWTVTTCTPFPGALCEEKAGNGNSMLFFPSGVVDLPDDLVIWKEAITQQPAYVQKMMNDSAFCTHSTSGREINSVDTRYELSLCDLLDNNLDIVFDARNERIMYRFDTTSTAEYIFISILGIYLVSCIAENIRTVMSSEERIQTWQQQIVYCIMILTTFCYVVYDFAAKNTYNFLLFEYERQLYSLLFAYVVVEFVIFAYGQLGGKNLPRLDGFKHLQEENEETPQHKPRGNAIRCISLLTAFLILLTARIHYSFDNPYIWLLSTIFGVRSFHKFINRLITETETFSVEKEKVKYYFKLLIHVFDASVFITVLVYAVVPSYNLTPEANAAVFLILTISLLSSMIVSYHAAGNLP